MTPSNNATLPLSFSLNGQSRGAEAPVRMHLADFLRGPLGCTGTHIGCEQGVCGACTVIVDGAAVRSCLMLAVQADGCAIQTIEGHAQADGALSALQAALRRHHGLQCGFCTPGVLATLDCLIRRNPKPTREQVQDALTANLCRCTGYKGMVDAVMDVTGQLEVQR